MKKKPSFLFGPYKALGVHTTAVKPVFFNNTGRKRPYVSLYCPINNTLSEYNAGRLRLITTSDCLPADITAVAVKSRLSFLFSFIYFFSEANERVYAAAGEAIYTFTFCRNVDRKIPLKCSVKHMLALGDQLVSFVSFCGHCFQIIIDFDHGLRVIDIESGEETLHLEGIPTFQVTSILHPATYINKVILMFAIVLLRSGCSWLLKRVSKNCKCPNWKSNTYFREMLVNFLFFFYYFPFQWLMGPLMYWNKPPSPTLLP